MMKRNAEVPMVTCPKCGNKEKETEFSQERGMCCRCWSYLAPEVGGTDHGVLMEKVHTGTEGCRSMRIRPRGFCGDIVEVNERVSYWGDPKGKWTVSVTWGSGGKDGTLDELRSAANFCIAVAHAVQVATAWKVGRS